MKSFLSYIVVCDFTEKELKGSWSFLEYSFSYSCYSVALIEKSHA